MTNLKTESYIYEQNDFAEENKAMKELTVTITLHEYRELIEDNALMNRDIPKLISEKEEAEKKYRDLVSLIMLKAPDAMKKILADLLDPILNEERNETEETEEVKE